MTVMGNFDRINPSCNVKRRRQRLFDRILTAETRRIISQARFVLLRPVQRALSMNRNEFFHNLQVVGFYLFLLLLELGSESALAARFNSRLMLLLQPSSVLRAIFNKGRLPDDVVVMRAQLGGITNVLKVHLMLLAKERNLMVLTLSVDD